MPARISLTMIVKNEERALPTCLAAARPWVDEIVVVDTGSTDRTREIAQAHGARVVQWAWRDDFAAARNESLRHATGDWVLALDADETLTTPSGPALRAVCDTATDDVVAFNIKIVCPYRGDGGLTQLNWFPRLFRNLPGVCWEGVIHEQVVPSLLGRGRIERSAVEVLHTGYVLSPEDLQAKARRNARLLERQLLDEPDFAPAWLQLAETYVCQGRIDEAIGAYRRCLRLVPVSRLTLTSNVVAVALQNLGAVLLTHRDEPEGLRLLQEALVLNPDLITARVQLGSHALRQQRWDEAEAHFAEALGIFERQRETPEYQICPWLIYRFYSQALYHQDRLPEAIDALEQSLALSPRNVETLQLLAMVTAKAAHWPRCLDALRQLQAESGDNRALQLQRVVALEALQRFDEAADACRAVLAYEPESPAVLARLGGNLARAGRFAAAAEVYERLTALTPDGPDTWVALAHCREAVADATGMLAAYRRAVELAPDSPEVLFALGSACLRAGLIDAAHECLASAVAHDPDQPHLRLAHIICLIRKGSVAEAAGELSVALERWPDLEAAHELRRLLATLPPATEPVEAGARRS